ncbi:MAG TPA: ABC transporter substrate-binding protein [Planctomycetota bacterium]|nr:ABC transporter substrate-binding protein [Planctomycetota bacterium]
MRNRALGLALTFALALLAASCGNAPSSSTNTSGKNPPASGEVKKYPIGAVIEKSGPLENWGKASEWGMRLAIEDLKGKDGIELELFVGDNKSTPEQSANEFISLANSKNVMVVLGAVASSNTNQMKAQADKLKVPIITHASTNVKLTKDTDWLFRICWNDAFQGAVCANFMVDHLKAKKAIIVTDAAQDYSRGLSKAFEETFKLRGGTIIEELTYQSGDKVFTSQVEKLKASEADGVFCSGYSAEVALLLKTARAAGYDKPFLGGDGLDDKQFFDIAGKAAGTGVYLCNHAHNDDPDEKIQNFVKAYTAKYKEPPGNAMAFLGYDAVLAVHDSIKRAAQKGPVTRESLRDAIASIKDLPLVTGTITVGQNKEVRKRAVVVKMKEDGSFEFVSEVKP